MKHRFEIRHMRLDGWLRMRDTQTGEEFEVPMNGTRILRSGDHGVQERRGGEVEAAKPAAPPAETTSNTVDPPKRAKRKANQRRSSSTATTRPADERTSDTTPGPSSPWARGKPNPLETQEGRSMPVDAKTLTAADRKVVEDHQALWAHVLGAKGSKKGGLGWEEATDAGRSGLRARFKTGAFKLLHAGGDVYALFYEWDNGKFERIACGKAEDLMALATERALAGLPSPPRTLLDLEMARFFCSSDPKQRELGAKRLEPYFREHELKADEPTSGDGGYPPPRPRRSRTTAKSSAKEPSPPAASPAPAAFDSTTTDGQVDPKRDAELMASFSQALAEFEDTE